MDWIGTAGLAVGIFILLTWMTSKRRKRDNLINKLPGPKPYPILGNILTFVVPRHELLGIFGKVHAEFGDIFRTWSGSRPVVHLVSPKYIEAGFAKFLHAKTLYHVILGANKHIQKGHIYKFIQPWLGTGLLLSAGKKWFTHRKLISPTFHFKILEGFVEIFHDSSRILVQKLASRADGEYFDISTYITRCALDIICETAMGTKVYAQENEPSPYVAATLKVSELIVQRQFKIWLHPDIIYYNTQQGKQFRENLAVLHGFTEKVIQDRKKFRNESAKNHQEMVQEEVGIKKKLAFLDLLLDSADGQMVPLSDLEVREEVDTFMFEGHDTTTMAISWTLLLLGNHPKIQDAVRTELEEIFQGENRAANIRDLGDMKLLERVIKESLRLYPSVTMITRLLDEDVKLGNHVIPAETNVAMHIFTMHRHPGIYPDPLKFDPDRFLPENVQKRHPYAYLPFSAGQRNCIGQKFAMYEEKVMLSSIIRNFHVKSLHSIFEVPCVHELVNRPLGGVLVKLTPAR